MSLRNTSYPPKFTDTNLTDAHADIVNMSIRPLDKHLEVNVGIYYSNTDFTAGKDAADYTNIAITGSRYTAALDQTVSSALTRTDLTNSAKLSDLLIAVVEEDLITNDLSTWTQRAVVAI